MSVFSLKIDIADNKFFNGETSPLFSQSQAKLARQFHQKIAGYRQHRFVRWTISQTFLG